MRSTRGLAITEKSLIQMRIVPAVLRNAQTLETVLHRGQVQTLATLELLWMCYVMAGRSVLDMSGAEKGH